MFNRLFGAKPIPIDKIIAWWAPDRNPETGKAGCHQLGEISLAQVEDLRNLA